MRTVRVHFVLERSTMRRLAILVIVFLLVGSSCAPAARAAGCEELCLGAGRSVQERARLAVPAVADRGAQYDDVWSDVWSQIVAQLRAWAAAIVRWFSGALRQGLAVAWERVRWELQKIWEWLKDLWKWMNLGGDVGPLR